MRSRERVDLQHSDQRDRQRHRQHAHGLETKLRRADDGAPADLVEPTGSTASTWKIPGSSLSVHV